VLGSSVPVCLCACLCLPVPEPVAGLSMPDINSSKGIRPASESRLVFQCISFVLRNPYQDYQDRLLLIHAEFNSGNPCCAKQSCLSLSHVFGPWELLSFYQLALVPPFLDGPVFPLIVSGDCGLGSLCCVPSHSWLAGWLAQCFFIALLSMLVRSLFALVVSSAVASLALLFCSPHLLVSSFGTL
jgi:hypothetical protein